MLEKNRHALKEWAVIVGELGEGRQIVLIRKGGILEQKKGFTVEHEEFFLFPTYVHQKEEDLIPSARGALPQVVKASPPLASVRFDYYAKVEEVFQVGEISRLKRLEGQHALSWDAVEGRFHYRRPGLHVLALRVFRLPAPLTIPHIDRYDGCVSWVDLGVEIETVGATPVLSDSEFQERLDLVRASLVQGVGARG